MAIDRINVWKDHRIQKRSAHLNGRTYGYLYGEPETESYRGTIFLIHGFPDLSMGWRFQIPMLLSLGLRVVAPDCMGYGRTDAPPYMLHDYGYKCISDDVAELARQLGIGNIILGGHDWGGAIVYRIALYHPDLVTALFSVCVPYFPPSPSYQPLKLYTSTVMPTLTYQHQFASGAIEEAIRSPAEIRALLNAFYGGRALAANKATTAVFNPEQGIQLDRGLLHSLSPTPLLTEQELDYYAAEFSRHGIHAPLNWYRVREMNWEEEYEHFFQSGKVKQPPALEQEVLFVLATKDTALKPELAKNMVPASGDKLLPNLRRREIDAGHWALWEKPDQVNKHVKEWLEEVILKDSQRGGSGGASKM